MSCSVMFQGLPVKSQTIFVEQNHNLVYECGFRFSGRSAEHAEQKPRDFESGPQNLDLSLLVEKFVMFREVPVLLGRGKP